MATSSSEQGTSMQITTGESYQIKGRTMKLEEWDLTVQTKNLVDFVSLTRNGYDLTGYLRYQDLSGYFTMLDGPTYKNLVKHFWVRAEIYDKYAAKAEEDHMVLLNPDLKGKSRAKMGLKEFTRTEIRSSIMGIQVTITEEVIGIACRRHSMNKKHCVESLRGIMRRIASSNNSMLIDQEDIVFLYRREHYQL